MGRLVEEKAQRKTRHVDWSYYKMKTDEQGRIGTALGDKITAKEIE